MQIPAPLNHDSDTVEHQPLTKECQSECRETHPFWSKVKIGGEDECWPFLGGKDKDGYGQYYLNGQKWRAHRFALVLSMGSAAMDLHALHECDTPACCNPAHLKPGTHQQNMEERDARGRQASGERNGRSKLDAETVRAIRAAYVPHKVSKRALATRFGVNFYIVRDIIDRVTWRGVEPEPPAPQTTGRRAAWLTPATEEAAL